MDIQKGSEPSAADLRRAASLRAAADLRVEHLQPWFTPGATRAIIDALIELQAKATRETGVS